MTASVPPGELLRLGGEVDPLGSAGTAHFGGGFGAAGGPAGKSGGGAAPGDADVADADMADGADVADGADMGRVAEMAGGADMGRVAGEAGGFVPVSRPEAPGVEINGMKLRQLRKLMGEDLKTFAGRAGITFQYLSQLELGVRRRVSPRTFGRICDALGVDDRREMMLPEEGHGTANAGGKDD